MQENGGTGGGCYMVINDYERVGIKKFSKNALFPGVDLRKCRFPADLIAE